jgi:hypothetical protein
METLGRGVTLHIGDRRSPSIEPVPELILAPSLAMNAEQRAVHDLLEQLDDAMFAAIEGDEGSSRRARKLWQRATSSLRGELLEESREHYLRFAAEALRQTGPGGVRDPSQTLAATEVIELLTT